VANRLELETSPYLLQHADNPVDWYPWGDEAFAIAAERDRPVLLSVGYSSCHWCHVMAHESFEDPVTASLMNELFVNVKVDREERPDVDATYMEVLQSTTGRGGWPMTVFLTPDRKPFYAGTYFPAIARHGMPSFQTVLAAVADAWEHRRNELTTAAMRLADLVGRTIPGDSSLPDMTSVNDAVRTIAGRFDSINGGFGSAPKFPQEPVLEFLLRVGSAEALEMTRTTLTAMSKGGIRDHVGGGFARYSIDPTWTIPHFEKMLYTNAQLARIYLRAGQALRETAFTEVALDTLGYLLHDLRLPAGAFASAEDADSEGEEGTFYLWDLDEIVETVGTDLAPLALATFGVTNEGNFEGRTHLTIVDAHAGDDLGIDRSTARVMLTEIRRRLRDHRATRPRPGLDDKIITAWNGLAIRTLAESGAVVSDPRLLHAAREAAAFIKDSMVVSGRLMRSWRQGRVSGPGFADDYASFALALFALYQATGDVDWYREAVRLTDSLIELFWDPDGGFFTSGADAETPLARTKDLTDSPMPSANSLAAEALLIASMFTGRSDLRSRFEETVQAAMPISRVSPMAAGHLLGVLHTALDDPREVAIAGPDAPRLASIVWEEFRPGVVVAVDTDGTGGLTVPLLEGRWSDQTLAYVCRGFVCDLPVSDPEGLRTRLGSSESTSAENTT